MHDKLYTWMLLFRFCLSDMIVLKLKIQLCIMYYYRRLKLRVGTFLWEGKGQSPRRLGWENLYLKLSNLQ